MTTLLAHLCTALVRHVYGDLPAEVYSTLLTHDRLRLLEICHHLNLPSKTVQNGLAVLAQHNLILFYPIDSPGNTSFQANLAQAYDIVRYAKHVKTVELRNGALAGSAIASMQTLGSSSLRALSASIKSRPTGDGDGDRVETNGHHKVPGEDGKTPNGTAEDEDTDESDDVNTWQIKRKSGKAVESDRAPRKRKRAATPTEDEEDLSPARTMRRLADIGYFEELRPFTFLPPTDFDVIIEEHLRRTEKQFRDSISGPKKSMLFRQAVEQYKREVLDGKASLPDDDDPTDDESSGPSSKKRKLNGLTSVSNGSSRDELVWYRLNIERLLVALRTEALTRYVQLRLGESLSKVYNAYLRLAEEEQELSGAPFHLFPKKKRRYAADQAKGKSKAREDDSGEEVEEESSEDPGMSSSITTSQIVSKLDEAAITLVHRDMDALYPEERVKPEEEEASDQAKGEGKKRMVNGKVKSDEAARMSRERLWTSVNRCLGIIAESPLGFLTRVESEGDGWQTDMEQLVRTLMQEQLEDVVEARFGLLGRRVIRMLHVKGKLDEKSIASMGMLRQGDARATLTQMQAARYIDVQEVPRDTGRTVSRTMFLWYFDQDRCRDVILGDIYKAMTRILQRQEHEKYEVRAVLEKASRTDVQGNEDKYLSAAEREALKEWRRKERKLLMGLERADELVMMFRDFLSPPVGKNPTS